MNRNDYLAIRKKLNLGHNQNALLTFTIQNLLLISVIAAVAKQDGLVAFLAIPLISTFIFRNFSMMHEAVHKAAHTSQSLNDFVGNISGGICLLPFEPWRKSHLDHHLWSGNIDKDPVTALITAFPKWKPNTQNSLSFFWKAWFPMLACMQYCVFYWLASKIYLKNKSSYKLLVSLLCPVFIWGTVIAFAPLSFSLKILLPALILYFVAVEVVNLPHHLQLPQYRGDTRLALWEQYKIARSCIYPKWFARFVALNFNYHTEHHMFPDVPWYHLESIHHEIKVVLTSSYNSDPYFEWILENKQKSIGDVLKAVDSAPSDEIRAA